VPLGRKCNTSGERTGDGGFLLGERKGPVGRRTLGEKAGPTSDPSGAVVHRDLSPLGNVKNLMGSTEGGEVWKQEANPKDPPKRTHKEKTETKTN